MEKAIEAAQKAAKKAIERTYIGILAVTEHRKTTDDITKITGYHDDIILKEQPCRLSYDGLQAASSTGTVVSKKQTIKLFLSPDISIKPGSKITVTQEGITADYTYSGIPAVYPTHQEIALESFGGWA